MGTSRRSPRSKPGAITAASLRSLSSTPGYIVVFREPSERNASLMSKVLKVGIDNGVSVRSSCAVLRAKAGGARTRIYHRLSLAVADLDADELHKIAFDDSVLAVVPNEVRHIPPIVAAGGPGARAPAAPSSPGGPAPGPGSDPIISYLRGMRDSIDSTLRFLGLTGVEAPRIAPRHGGRRSATTTPAGHSWCLEQVGLPAGAAGLTGAGITVAVLDTGIDLDHPDLADRFAGGAYTASFIPGETVQDGHGHGTHCAGVIGGPVLPEGGIRYGVAPECRLVIGKVLSNAGSGTDDGILDGIDWAADQGAKIISMSLGSRREAYQPHAVAYETVASVLLRDGILIVAAAGNDSYRPYWTTAVGNPAACPSIMAVAAVDENRDVAWFSNCQKDDVGEVNVAGPGVAVYSAWKDRGYNVISGTSMATPHVAGAAALYMEEQSQLTGQLLWNELEQNAVALSSGPQDTGFGLVQVPHAAGLQESTRQRVIARKAQARSAGA